MLTILTLIVCLLSTLPIQVLAAQDTNTEVTPESPITRMTQAELANGRTLFGVHCGRCHGMLGDGGEGPSLKRANLHHAPDDQALFEVIQEGIQGTGMPGTFGPNDSELWQIAAHVRSLGRLPPEDMPGDPQRGRVLYDTKGGCAACHITSGEGRGVGPELTDVGLRRNLSYLERSLTNPDADHPMLTSWMTGRINGFLTVRVVSPAGEYEGLRVNENEFSIQLRDLTGSIHSFRKEDLLDLQRAFGHSLMPGYETVLDPGEVNDLVSYLMSLKGEQ